MNSLPGTGGLAKKDGRGNLVTTGRKRGIAQNPLVPGPHSVGSTDRVEGSFVGREDRTPDVLYEQTVYRSPFLFAIQVLHVGREGPERKTFVDAESRFCPQTFSPPLHLTFPVHLTSG